MAIFKDKNPPRNTRLEDISELPKQEVERIDGLPTKEDFERMLGKAKDKKPEPESQDPESREQGRSVISIQLSGEQSPEDLADFIKKIVKIMR